MQFTGMTLSGGFTLREPPIIGEMSLTFNTNLTPGSLLVGIPFNGVGTVDINWGDGNTDIGLSAASSQVHTYATNGTYEAIVTGSFTKFSYGITLPGRGSQGLPSLISVNRWNNALGITDVSFFNCVNLTAVPSNLPNTVTRMDYMFFNNPNFNDSNITSWNTSKVTTINNMFRSSTNFNQNIGSWNVSNVTDMGFAFFSVSRFNQDISSWNVSKVTDMQSMFNSATDFNQNLSSWVTGLTGQPANFSNGANATFANNASNLKPYLSGGVTRINT